MEMNQILESPDKDFKAGMINMPQQAITHCLKTNGKKNLSKEIEVIKKE